MAEFIRAIRFIRVIRGWVEKLGAIGIKSATGRDFDFCRGSAGSAFI